MNSEFRANPSRLKKFDFIGPFLLGCVYAIFSAMALSMLLHLIGIDPDRNDHARVMIALVALAIPVFNCIRHFLYWMGVEARERCVISDEGVVYFTPFNKRIFMRWDEITNVRLEDGDNNDGPSFGSKTIVSSSKDQFAINDMHFESDAFYELRQVIRLKSPPAAKKFK